MYCSMYSSIVSYYCIAGASVIFIFVPTKARVFDKYLDANLQIVHRLLRYIYDSYIYDSYIYIYMIPTG